MEQASWETEKEVLLTMVHPRKTQFMGGQQEVGRFDNVVKKFAAQFQADFTYSLIVRLHHNVVKTAVRTISLAYSRITFADIAAKLQLDSSEDAEHIVAKVGRRRACR